MDFKTAVRLYHEFLDWEKSSYFFYRITYM